MNEGDQLVMENLQNMPADKGYEVPLVTRVDHWANSLLLEALQGLIKRFGAGIVGTDNDLCLYRLIETNTPEKDKAENTFFWSREVLKEVQIRLAENRISWPLKE
jgi:hypothetical protein